MDKVSYNAGWDAFKAGVNRDDYPFGVDAFAWCWGWDAAAEWELDKTNLVP